MLRPHLLRKLTNLFALGQEVFLTPDKRFASLEVWWTRPIARPPDPSETSPIYR
jgi:hypothetical protein